MADLKISDLNELAGGDLVAGDELAIVDDSASETKKIGVANLIENGVTLISDDAIPGAKILFAAGDIVTADLADNAVTTAKIADDAITSAKLANESTVTLVTALPASGDFTGQLALDTGENALYVWDSSAWVKAEGGITDVDGSTTGIINIVSTIASGTATISASLDDTTTAAQFLAGPVGAAGTVGYRTIDGGDLPVATTTSKGGVIVDGSGLQMNGNVIEVANTVTASSVNHLVTYDANGLITGGATIASGDLPIATTAAVGAVSVGDGLAVDAAGSVSVDNTATAGEYTKVTINAKGLVTSGETLAADDIPDLSASKITSGTFGTSLIASDAITAAKLADQSTTKFGGAAGSDNVTIFPTGDFKGQFFYDETTQDLYIYTGSAFVPVTVLSGNLVNAGAYNASTNQMSSVTSAGSSAGFSVGNALPAPAKTNLNHYVVVDTSGTGTGAAPAVALAPPDMLLSQGVGTEYSLIDVSNAIAGQTASNISSIATGDIVATDVQAAITELDQEKLPKAGGTMTGDLHLTGANTFIAFEGSSVNDAETYLGVHDPSADRFIYLPDVNGTLITDGDTGTVTSTMIADGTIANGDISSTAEIAVSKLANGTARQLLQTDSIGTGVEFASNIDIPGTLDVTGAATFDNTVAMTSALVSVDYLSYGGGSASAAALYSGSDTDTGIYAPASDEFGITTNGVSRIVIDSSGNVGIGSTDPNKKLELSGDGTAIIRLTDTDNALSDEEYSSGIEFYQSDTSGAGVGASINAKGDGSTGDLQLTVNTGDNSEALRVDGSGKVAIGTTTTSALGATIKDTDTDFDSTDASSTSVVHVSGGSTAGLNRIGGTISLSKVNSTRPGAVLAAVQTSSDNDQMGLAVYTHASSTTTNTVAEKFRITHAGDVGIGTQTPGSQLELYANDPAITFNGGASANSQGLNFTYAGTSYGEIKYELDGDFMRFHTSESERLRIDSSGQVGVGETSPGSKLHVKGTSGAASRIHIQSTSGGASSFDGSGSGLLLTATGMNTTNKFAPALQFGSTDGQLTTTNPKVGAAITGIATETYGADTDSGMALAFYTRPNNDGTGQSINERARLDANGRMYIGSTSIRNVSSATSPKVFIENDSSVTVFALVSNNTTGPNICLGATGGSANGDNDLVADDQELGSIRFAGADGTNLRSTAAKIAGVVDGTPGADDMPGRLIFSTTSDGSDSPTERMRIRQDGGICFGTTTNIPGYGNSTVGTAYRNSDGTFHISTDGETCLRLNRNTSNGTVARFSKDGSGTQAGTITITATTTAYNESSDYRLKENVVDIADGITRVKQLQPRRFNFIADSATTVDGFIAHEAQTVVPEAVTGTHNEVDEDGNPVMQQIDKSKLVPLLTAALQEAIAKIETLETKVAALEAGN
jgi:hypothetical protein